MIPTYKEKMQYLQEVIEPMLEEAFKRGDQKYTGMNHNDNPDFYNRGPAKDIDHVRTFHVDVRLKEAEHAAIEGNDIETALEKIESAIGYLTILHYRVNNTLQEG